MKLPSGYNYYLGYSVCDRGLFRGNRLAIHYGPDKHIIGYSETAPQSWLAPNKYVLIHFDAAKREIGYSGMLGFFRGLVSKKELIHYDLQGNQIGYTIGKSWGKELHFDCANNLLGMTQDRSWMNDDANDHFGTSLCLPIPFWAVRHYTLTL